MNGQGKCFKKVTFGVFFLGTKKNLVFSHLFNLLIYRRAPLFIFYFFKSIVD